MHVIFFIVTVGLISILPNPQEKTADALNAVPSVDPQRYCGTWYEIARLPNSFQDKCVGDVTATYSLDGDAFVVVNRCRKEDGEISEAVGRARRASGDSSFAKLKVRFAPAILAFLPFVWGDYWIIDLADDYSYAVVGEPSRKYLWILARTTSLPAATMQQILGRIGQQGYNPKNLLFTKHTESGKRID